MLQATDIHLHCGCGQCSSYHGTFKQERHSYTGTAFCMLSSSHKQTACGVTSPNQALGFGSCLLAVCVSVCVFIGQGPVSPCLTFPYKTVMMGSSSRLSAPPSTLIQVWITYSIYRTTDKFQRAPKLVRIQGPGFYRNKESYISGFPCG